MHRHLLISLVSKLQLYLLQLIYYRLCFLRFEELAKLRCCDINFRNFRWIMLKLILQAVRPVFIGMKTLLFWLGQVLSIVLIRYFINIFILFASCNHHWSDFLLRNAVYHKSTCGYSLGILLTWLN